MMNTINIGTQIDLDDMLISRLLIQANSGGGKSVLARAIIEASHGIVPFIVMDCDGEYYTLKEKLEDVIVIGGQAADIPISLQSVKLLPREIIGNRLSVVIDLSEMKMTERIHYVKLFVETMMELPKQFWVSYLVFLEEVHKFCGEQDKQESGPAIRDLMSRGRKMGFCGIPITQRISKLHKDVAAEVNNKFVGRTNLDIDMDRAAKELGFTTSSTYTRLSLRDLPPGHFYAYGTSIKPHHVHEVIIKLPATKIPKAGNIVDIKPKKPTEKLLAALAKLNQLPKQAEKEMKDVKELQAEVTRLRGELTRAAKATPALPVPSPVDEKKIQGMITRATDHVRMVTKDFYTDAIRVRDKALQEYKDRTAELHKILARISEAAGNVRPFTAPIVGAALRPDIKPTAPMAKMPEKRENFPKNGISVQKIDKTFQGDGSLGKCAHAILSFLVSHSDRDFTKAQVAIATGYSPGSGGFNNSLAALNSRALIIRGSRLKHNEANIVEITRLIGDPEPLPYDIETFKKNLGQCERQIYEVLLANPETVYDKEGLANETEAKYSATSGGFNNSLSRLNTLELIERDNGKIRLNPELLELMN